jgi:hypothetical protein
MDKKNMIGDALSQAKDAVFYRMTELLTERFPNSFLLETESPYFDVVQYAREGHCTITPRADTLSEFEWHWYPADRDHSLVYNGWLDVAWEESRLQIVEIGIEGSHCRTVRHYLIGDTEEIARSFFDAVCQWNSEIRGEVLVFEFGHWRKSASLFESIKSSSFDNLVLAGDLKSELWRDVSSFFEAQETYARYGVAWKRGILLIGPPGNGKTHMVKAIINRLNRPCLYVRSFQARHSEENFSIHLVFERARATAPCVVVLEDLDSLISDTNRSFFLNEMDGFAANEGILCLATTNHPERLDPALLERRAGSIASTRSRCPALPSGRLTSPCSASSSSQSFDCRNEDWNASRMRRRATLSPISRNSISRR